jgi:ubiquinone biosynthesis monooxygenase Coq7
LIPAHELSEATLPPDCSAVLFDGSCPLCRREIAMYRELPAVAPIEWIDISLPNYKPPAGITRRALMQRFHVVAPNGELLSGARAFVQVWSQLPGWRHLARLAKLPMAMAFMEMLYRFFLLFRPWMQAAYRFIQRPSR